MIHSFVRESVRGSEIPPVRRPRGFNPLAGFDLAPPKYRPEANNRVCSNSIAPLGSFATILFYMHRLIMPQEVTTHGILNKRSNVLLDIAQ